MNTLFKCANFIIIKTTLVECGLIVFTKKYVPSNKFTFPSNFFFAKKKISKELKNNPCF